MKLDFSSGIACSALAIMLVSCGNSSAQESVDEVPTKAPKENPVQQEPQPSFSTPPAANDSKESTRAKVDAAMSEREQVLKENRRIQHLRVVHNNPEQALKTAVQRLYRYSSSGTVTKEDFDREERKKIARTRAQTLSQFLTHDLNGDLEVTRLEVEESMRGQQSGKRATLEVAFLNNDEDGDEALSINELLTIANTPRNARSPRLSEYEQLSIYDLNDDGTINPQEVADAIDAIVAQPMPESKRHNAPRSNQAQSTCALPAASKNAQVVVISGNSGAGLSTVAVNGPSIVTTVANIEIEAGDGPLYIFANAQQSTIWNLSGATDRVEKFVVQPRKYKETNGAGVIGLSKKTVSFIEPRSCGTPASSTKDGKAAVLRGLVNKALGKEVDTLIAYKKLGDVAVPAGTLGTKSKTDIEGPMISTPSGDIYIKDGKPVPVEQDGLTFSSLAFVTNYPGGIIELDAEDVVSPGSAENYEILPVQAGIAQLTESGHLTKTPDGYYMIEKTFEHFPAGLAGAHSTKFILKKGVEMPSGGVGHSSVLSEETGECLTGSRCR